MGSLSLQQLKQAVRIREQIDDLEKELGRIVGVRSDTAINSVPSRRRRLSTKARNRISAAAKARWAKVRRGRSVRASKPAARAGSGPGHAPLKERIVRALRSAGGVGVSVKDLSRKLGKSYGNVSVWFHTTGKGMKEIKKVAPGRFAWAQ
jgi:hypothetical protein